MTAAQGGLMQQVLEDFLQVTSRNLPPPRPSLQTDSHNGW